MSAAVTDWQCAPPRDLPTGRAHSAAHSLSGSVQPQIDQDVYEVTNTPERVDHNGGDACGSPPRRNISYQRQHQGSRNASSFTSPKRNSTSLARLLTTEARPITLPISMCVSRGGGKGEKRL